jgi:hypothetical protein
MRAEMYKIGRLYAAFREHKLLLESVTARTDCLNSPLWYTNDVGRHFESRR